MNKEKLEFFGTLFENSDESLEYIVKNNRRLSHSCWTPKQARRVEKELEIIKNLGVEKVFHLLLTIINHIKNERYFVAGSINNSYICYLLGITNVDSEYYDLPFEIFLNDYSKYPPSIYLYVEQGTKGKIIGLLDKLFGINKIIRAKDSLTAYYFSKEDVVKEGLVEKTNNYINNSICHCVELVSTLDERELNARGYYCINLEERSTFNETAKAYFTEEEIYDKTKALFDGRFSKVPFEAMEDVQEILQCTDNILVYQEQFIGICNKLLDMPNDKANCFRKEFCYIGRDKIEAFKTVLFLKYNKSGIELFNYLRKNTIRTITKGHVIGELAIQKHYEEE